MGEFNRSKEWWMKKAREEPDVPIFAGLPDGAWHPVAEAKLDGTRYDLWHRLWDGVKTGYYHPETEWWRIGDAEEWFGVGIFPSHFREPQQH